jgi:hypothetical protein
MSNKFPLSFSRLSMFDNCEHQFEHIHVNKTVKDLGSDATQYGSRVHESLAKYGETSSVLQLTKETVKWKPLIDRARRNPGKKYWELEMAFTQDLKECSWFDKDTWMRNKADYLCICKDTATYLDWKTGKVRDNIFQLQLSACLIMYKFPQVDKVKAAFVYLQHEHLSSAIFHRKQLDSMWSRIMEKCDKVQAAVDSGVFEAKPSPLCNWCAAKHICQYRR